MNTLKLWFRPAMLLVLWFLATAFTLSELATVAPLLHASGAKRPRIAEARQRPPPIRTQLTTRAVLAP